MYQSSPVDFGTAHSTHMKPTEDSMSKLRVHNFAISLDGYGAGPRQGREHPLGVGGEELHGWYVGTRAFREINGKTGGTTGPDNDFAKRFGEGIGAPVSPGAPHRRNTRRDRADPARQW